MEKQRRLFHPNEESYENSELFQGKEPEIKIVKNTFMSAGGMVREVTIKKTWLIPIKQL